ncbi:conserved membrane hypothetical protein [Pseudomonas veronii]|nr:conserved membrane hypothetical protein [Pseudomonas veronii]
MISSGYIHTFTAVSLTQRQQMKGGVIMGFWSDMDELVFGPPGVAGGLFGDAIDAICENPLTTIGVVAATVATGGIAFVAAPAIATAVGGAGLLGAASTGTAISTLSGAALTNASLAALGGGAVAAGGGGIAAGTAVVAGTGALTGAAVSGGVAAATS